MMKINRLLSWPVVFLFLMCGTALAATDIPSPDTDVAGWIKLLYAAVTSKAWTVVFGLALVGITYPLRRWGGSLIPWFKTALGGLVLGFLVSLAATLGVATAAGAPLTLTLVAASLSSAAAAAGIWEWLKAHIPGVQAAAEKSGSTPTIAGRSAATAVPFTSTASER